MRRLVIRARALAAEGQPVEDKLIVISGKRIESILPSSAAKRFSNRDFVGSHRYLVAPGLIDLHCHGGGGGESTSLGGLLAAAYFHASHGTLAFLVSALFTGFEDLERLAETVKKARPSAPLKILGIHLEGPFLNPEARGSIPHSCLRPVRPEDAARILQSAGDELRSITLAPELPGAEGVIRMLAQAGVTVALGHSLATADQARAATDGGARLVTHLGNAMGPFHQREPGLVGAGLADPRLTAEIIADGNHLADETLSTFLRGKAGDVVLVSDCRSLGGLPEGSQLESYGENLEVRNGAARYADGTLAGAVQPLWTGVRRVAGLQGFSIWDALRLATVNPAKVLNLRGPGRISVNGRADLVLAGPDFSVCRVFYGGEEVFHAPDEPPLPA